MGTLSKFSSVPLADISDFNGVAKGSIAEVNAQSLAAAPTIITTNLVQHLDAGDSSSYSGSGTTWFDLTSSNVDGTFRGAPTYSSTDGGGSFSFDGVDDAIKFDYDDAAPIRIGEDSGEVNAIGGSGISRTYGDLSSDGGFTIQVWAKQASGQVNMFWCNNTSVTTSEATNPRYKYYQGLEFLVNGNGHLILFVFDGNGGNAPADRRWRRSSSGQVTGNTWELYTAVLYGDTVTQIQNDSKIYVNGSEVSGYDAASGSGAGLGYRAKQANSQGSKYHAGIGMNRGNFRQGHISQVLVYNDILTDAEVLANFNATKARYGY